MRTLLVMVAALALAPTGWAADTDVENPGFRDLPLQRGSLSSGAPSAGAVSGGKRHQPTQAEIDQRAQERGRAADEQKRASDDLYQRVLKQSQQGTPPSIDPPK